MVGRADAPRDDDVNSLYDNAPCGYLSTTPDGMIIKVNQTFLTWTGFTRDELVDRTFFVQLLSVGGRLYHETHYLPLLQLQGRAHEIALDIVGPDGRRLPTLVNAVLERDESSGEPRVIRAVIFDATERRRYEQDLVHAREAARVAEANARRIAETLQKTLIPPELAAIDGLDISAVYRPAGTGAEIGGDFYDLFQISADHWVLALGDVQGKGVEAAVITALARYTIRASAVEHHSPAVILQNLNAVLRVDPTERLCTALIVSLRRAADNGWHATISSGGHPLPIFNRAGHATIELGRTGSLLGFFDHGTFHDHHVDLVDGDILIAYTDGVSEARRGREFYGEARIAAHLGQRPRTAEAITRELVDDVLAFEGFNTRDDIAVVAVRVAR